MEQKVNFLHKIIMFITLFCSADTLLFGSTEDTGWILVRYIMETGIVVWLLGRQVYKKKIAVTGSEICLISMVLLTLCSGIFNRDWRFGYIYIIILLIMGWTISKDIPFETFANYFCEFMKVFSVISVIFFGLYVCLNGLMEILPVVTNTAGREHYTIILASMPTEFYLDQYRNSSFFREPGVFQMYLVWAMMLEVFWKKKINVMNCIVFLTALITTFSTTAYIAVAILVVCYFFKKGDDRDAVIKKILFVAGGLLLIWVVRYTDLLAPDGIIFGKFTSSGHPSVSARYASFIVNIIMIFKSPLWGNGLSFTGENFSAYAMEYLNLKVSDNTIMVLYMMATLGIIFGILFMIGIWKYCTKITESRMLQFGLLSIFLVLFIGENLIFSPITYIFVFYGFGEWNRVVKYNESLDSK